ncbi:FmdB family zinc ribbon protein [Herbaspirillum seropedicae]|uniref:FmdB family zinc ribbon protein n=1 Tax=Herbaspirillum seropedicae TaxID=964 RepID=UPI003F8D03C0
MTSQGRAAASHQECCPTLRKRPFNTSEPTMPLFDFLCTACDTHFEKLVRVGDTPACPSCGSHAVLRQVSAPQAPGKSAGILQRARAQAAREGHFSNYRPSELRNKLK